MLPKLIFLFKNHPLHKTYKEDYAYYSYDKNVIIINLPIHFSFWKEEDEIILNLCKTIGHEYLHVAIWECRKNLQDKIIYEFFEEKLISELMGEIFEEEGYYHLIQE